MLKRIMLIVAICCLCACSFTQQEVQRVEVVDYSTISEALYTRLPGDLFYNDGYLIWVDPFARDGFVHILDEKSGKDLLTWGTLGEGPQEFNMPVVSYAFPPYIQIHDMNKDLQATLKIDRQVNDSVSMSVTWGQKKEGNYTRCLQLDDTAFIYFSPEADKPFRIDCRKDVVLTGEYPLKEKITNGFDVYQGEIVYNNKCNLLLFYTYSFPYMAMYKYKDGEMLLEWEEKTPDYFIKDGALALNKDTPKGINAAVFTKDYIIKLQGDELTEGEYPKNVSGRDMSQLPQSLFVYDYKARLTRIINMKLPVVRLAGDLNTNNIYAIIANPEFCIIRLSIDEVLNK